MANSGENKDTDIDFKKLVTTVAMENFINSTYVRGSYPALNKKHLANGLYNLMRSDNELISNEIVDEATTQHTLDSIFATDNDIESAFSN